MELKKKKKKKSLCSLESVCKASTLEGEEAEKMLIPHDQADGVPDSLSSAEVTGRSDLV